MNQLDRDVYAQARNAHKTIYLKIAEIKRNTLSRPNPRDLVDSIYALKDAHSVLTDVCKEIKKLYELFEKLTCMAWSQGGDHEPIRTAHCTGSPDLKQTVITPKFGTPEYSMLAEHFGIPEGVPFRPHWPTMLESISKTLVEGGNIPPGCDPGKMLTQYRVTIRNKKGVDDGRVSDPDLLKKLYKIIDDFMLNDDVALDVDGLRAIYDEQRERDSKQEEKDASSPKFIGDDDDASMEEDSPF